MLQPDDLKSAAQLPWSVGSGVDAWELFRAAIAGDVPALDRLIRKDPALVRSMHEYRTGLYFAVRENQVAAARFLIDRGADLLHSIDRLGEMARDRGYTEMEHLLSQTLAERWNVRPDGETIAAAIRERDLAKVRTLLDGSPDLLTAADERTNQPIHWAAMTRQIDVVDELIARGADVNAARGDGARPIQLTNGDYHYRGWRDVPGDGDSEAARRARAPARTRRVLRHLHRGLHR